MELTDKLKNLIDKLKNRNKDEGMKNIVELIPQNLLTNVLNLIINDKYEGYYENTIKFINKFKFTIIDIKNDGRFMI